MDSTVVKLLAAIVTAAALIWAGWHAHTIYDKAEERDKLAQTIKDQKAAQDEALEIARRTEEKIGSLRVVNKTIQNEVQREVTEKTVYRDCVLTDNGWMRLLQSIAQTAGSGKSAGPVPAPTGTP